MHESIEELRARLAKLEESLAFGEHTAERQLADMAEMSKLLFQIVERMERVESRLTQFGDKLSELGPDDTSSGDPVDDRPPHSGRLPGDR